MKSNLLLRTFTLMLALGISFSQVYAQQKQPLQTHTDAYPYTLSSFYIGARGGYLFKNGLANDPAFYLNSGYFGELNFGWRAKNSWLGWNLSTGRLHLDRKIPFTNNGNYALSVSDVMKNTLTTWLWDSTQKDDQAYTFGDNPIDTSTSASTDLGSWYAMTGPEFWFGKGKFQGFLSLNAGVGMTKFGYYYSGGTGAIDTTYQYDYTTINGKVYGPVSVGAMSPDRPGKATYYQYGMTKDAAGTLSTSPILSIKDEAQLSFMARATVGFDYFISPQFSINASASYWYIMTPDWAAQKSVQGNYFFSGKGKGWNPVSGGKTDPFLHGMPGGAWVIDGGSDKFSMKQTMPSKDLGYVGVNIGIKIWLDKKAKTAPAPMPENIPASKPLEKPQEKSKNILVTVKDKPTGYALSGVKVTVYKNGEAFYTGMTDANGSVPVIEDVQAGNYSIQGILNGIKTTVADVDSADFKGSARVINRELLHNDLRFTLVGHTLNAQTEARIAHVKTTLNQDRGGVNSFQMSDDQGEFRFQLKPDADFTVYAEQKGYFSNRAHVTTKGLDRSKTLYVDLRLAMNVLKKGAHFELKNIYYDFDRSDIRPDAAKVLDDVYKMLTDNPTVAIELSSYTDSRGSDSYNMKLSRERANAAVQYLVNKGIDAARLTAKGYGESRPVNGCVNGIPCTDAQHQANRRTEIKILKE